MADQFVTQVSKSGQPAKAAQAYSVPNDETPLKRGQVADRSKWFSSLFCCFGRGRPTSRFASIAQPGVAATPETWPQHVDPGSNLLPLLEKRDEGRKCLVLDLDETLVHSSFTPIGDADFVVPIEIEGVIHHVYVLKRPHVDLFLQRLGEIYEIVLFTASLSKYADPVCDLLDTHRVFRHRLFREHCVRHCGHYVKDLSRLGRDEKQTIIVDNSPFSYKFHPHSAVPIESWFDDPHDVALLELMPFFENLAHEKDATNLELKCEDCPDLPERITRARAAVAIAMGQ